MILRKSQTATEYLIILAVVIVIALIVIGVLGGIPFIGGGASSSASEARLKSLGIGVENYAFSNISGIISFKNNKADSVSVTAVYVDGKECGYGSFILKAGQIRKMNCTNITSSSEIYEYSLSVNWTDVNSGSKYVQDFDDLKVGGSVSLGLNTNVGRGGSVAGGSVVSSYILIPNDYAWSTGTLDGVNITDNKLYPGVLFNDSFDDGSSDLSFVGSPTVTADPANGSNNVLYIANGGDHANYQYTPTFVDNFVFKYRHRQNNLNTSGSGYVTLYSVSTMGALSVHYRNDDGGFAEYSSGSYSSIQTANLDTWYEIELFDFDFTSKSYGIRIDGSDKGRYDFSNSVSDVKRFSFGQYDVGNDVYFDDIVVQHASGNYTSAIYDTSVSSSFVSLSFIASGDRVNFMGRSCDDASCSGESYVNLGSTSPLDLSGLSANRYFQFYYNYSTNATMSPILSNVTIGYNN